MITATEKNFIVKMFGGKYATPLANALKKMRVFNSLNQPYSPESIQMFVGGHRENLAAEMAILKAANAENKRQKALAQQRKLLLK